MSWKNVLSQPESIQTRKRLVKNAAANLGRGSASGVITLLLPPLLVRHISPVEYGIWVLLVQVSAYVGYLDLGLQTAVGRYVAYATEKGDLKQRDAVFSTAVVALAAAAFIGISALIVTAALVPKIFPDVPRAFVPAARLSLVILGISTTAGLPAAAWGGVFVGKQEYEIPALIVGGGKLIAAIAIVSVASLGGSLVAMAIAMTVSNILSYLTQYLALRRWHSDVVFKRSLVSPETTKELLGYCASLTVMSLSMLFVSGFDLLLVGRFQFGAVPVYSASAILTAFVSGALYAILNVLMPHAASRHARQLTTELGDIVVSSTRIGVLLLVFTGVPLLVFAEPVLRLWAGPAYLSSGNMVLITLVVANIVRLLGAPYSVILIGAGQQRLAMVSPIAEAVTNFVASVVLGALMGAPGVALGTLIGAFVSVGAHLFFSMPKTRQHIWFSRRRFLLSGVLAPLLSTSPLLVIAVRSIVSGNLNFTVFCTATITSICASTVLLGRSKLYEFRGSQDISC